MYSMGNIINNYANNHGCVLYVLDELLVKCGIQQGKVNTHIPSYQTFSSEWNGRETYQLSLPLSRIVARFTFFRP